MQSGHLEEEGHVEERGYGDKEPSQWSQEDCLKWALDTELELSLTESSCLNLFNFETVTGHALSRYEEGDFKQLVHYMYAPYFFKAFRKLIEKSHSSYSHNQPGPANNMLPALSTSFMDSSRNLSTLQQRSNREISTSNDCNLPYTDGSSLLLQNQPSSFTLDFDNSIIQKEQQSTYFTQPVMLSGGSVFFGTSKNTQQSFSTRQSYQSPEMEANYILPDYFDSLDIQNSDFDLMNLTEIESDLEQQDFHDLDQIVHGSQREWTLDYDRRDYSTNSEVGTIATCPPYPTLAGDEQRKKGKRKRKKIQGAMEAGTSDSVCGVGPVSAPDSTILDFLLKKNPNKFRSDRERHPHVWQYLMRFLLHPDLKDKYVRWEDEEHGQFRLLKPQEIAAIWGSRSRVRDRLAPLDYNNFAKTIRLILKACYSTLCGLCFIGSKIKPEKYGFVFCCSNNR